MSYNTFERFVVIRLAGYWLHHLTQKNNEIDQGPGGILTSHNALVISFPEGGGGGADVGEYGDFMGTLQQISALVVGEMLRLRFMNALLSEKIWGLCFCSNREEIGNDRLFA